MRSLASSADVTLCDKTGMIFDCPWKVGSNWAGC